MTVRVIAVAILMLSCTSAHSQTVADEPQPGVKQLLGRSLMPGHEEQKLLRDNVVAGEIAQTLGSLPNVVSARVHLNLADRSMLSRDREALTTALAVLVVAEGGGPSESEVLQIVAASVPDLDESRVVVSITEEEREDQSLVSVGPILVDAGSAPLAMWMLAGLLLACACLAIGLVYAGLRIRKMKRRVSGPRSS